MRRLFEEPVEAELVDLEQFEPGTGHLPVDSAIPPHFGVVTDPFQEPVGQTGSTSGALGDLPAPLPVEHCSQHRRRPAQDDLEVAHLVVVQPGDEPEAVA